MPRKSKRSTIMKNLHDAKTAEKNNKKEQILEICITTPDKNCRAIPNAYFDCNQTLDIKSLANYKCPVKISSKSDL